MLRLGSQLGLVRKENSLGLGKTYGKDYGKN